MNSHSKEISVAQQTYKQMLNVISYQGNVNQKHSDTYTTSYPLGWLEF